LYSECAVSYRWETQTLDYKLKDKLLRTENGFGKELQGLTDYEVIRGKNGGNTNSFRQKGK